MGGLIGNKGSSLVEIMVALAIFSISLLSVSTLIGTNQRSFQLAEQRRMVLLNDEKQLRKMTASTTTPWFNNFIRVIKSGELSELLGDPAEAFGQSDCQLTGEESWQSPIVTPGPDLGPGVEATGIFGRGGIIFLSTNNANPRDASSTKEDFFIIDARNPTRPTVLSKIDTGPGLSSVGVVGNYAYLGNTSINAQLQVADISDLLQPRIVTSYKLPGNYNDGTTIPNSIFYNRQKIYLGTAKSQIEELHIIDLKDPLHPNEIGRIEIGGGINDILVSNNYLFLATPLNKELSVFNVIDPIHPVALNGFDAPGGSGNGKSLAREKNILFLGRTVGKNELFVLDVSDPNKIQAISSYLVGDSVNALIADSKHLFLGTNKKFEILDISDLTNIRLIISIDLPFKVSDISCSGKSIFISLLSSEAVRIIQPN